MVAVGTRGRASELRRCVDSLTAQDLPDDVELEVLVVDNNDRPGRLELPEGARVVHEPIVGIPHVRNRAVTEARTSAVDALAFIDDDELAAAGWLRALLDGIAHHRADVATGPVLPQLPPDVSTTVARHPFMRKNRSFATGTKIKDAYTNNVLVRRSVFERDDFRFDERMAASGGSDTELFRRMARGGVDIVWIDEAAVLEPVTDERATVGWILRRSWRLGVNRIQRLRYGGQPAWRWGLLLVGALGEFVLGAIIMLTWPVRPDLGLRGLDRLVRSVATYAAVFRAGANEYGASG